jgi:hypothetical protein
VQRRRGPATVCEERFSKQATVHSKDGKAEKRDDARARRPAFSYFVSYSSGVRMWRRDRNAARIESFFLYAELIFNLTCRSLSMRGLFLF